jgi:DNA-directed RNA polymerase subunit alpha
VVGMSLNKNWNSLIKPKLIYDSSPDNVIKIVVEPLERGFGLTIGNALRRILLSSLQGAAITSIKIPGVVHEFSPVPGVREDLVDIILNLKSIAIKMYSADRKVLRLKAVGPCVVTAGMIECGHDVEILSQNLVLCTLAKGMQLEMELVCETGRGYAPAASSRDKDFSIGVIPIDSLFSPVKKVAYTVENARVGQVTDYDKLIMTVETNGVVTPETAVGIAARILADQVQPFITFEEEPDEKHSKFEELPFNAALLIRIDNLELSVRSANCLKNENIVYLGDLVIKSEAEMLRTPNFGRKSLNEIKEILNSFGLKFGMDVSGWPPENLEELSKRHEEPY